VKPKIIQQGAEAIIYKKDNLVLKDRISKSYRISELDKKIRTRRTKAEAKLLLKASKIINAPIPLTAHGEGCRETGWRDSSDKLKIPFIDGKKLSEHLENFPLAKQKQVLKQIGKDIAKLHKQHIIHGDLTTSNMILVEDKTNSPIIFFIDFGLGYFNGKYEDKAVDIHLLKQALEAKHFKHWRELYKEFEKGYRSINKSQAEKVLQRLKVVEKRGRYKH
tara:strand:- start:988 stop:1647 length:660 start_codon:yes stop_codon:yes gene_type:complete